MQVVLIYLEWFRRNSLLKCVSQAEIEKKTLETPIIIGVQGLSRSLMLVPPENSSAVVCYDKQQVCVYLQQFSR